MADSQSPFTSLEAAHEYVGLLLEAVQQTRGDVAEDVADAAPGGRGPAAPRRCSWSRGSWSGSKATSPRVAGS